MFFSAAAFPPFYFFSSLPLSHRSIIAARCGRAAQQGALNVALSDCQAQRSVSGSAGGGAACDSRRLDEGFRGCEELEKNPDF